MVMPPHSPDIFAGKFEHNMFTPFHGGQLPSHFINREATGPHLHRTREVDPVPRCTHSKGVRNGWGGYKLTNGTHRSTSANVVDNDANQLSANSTRWGRSSAANCNSPIPHPPDNRIVYAVVAMWSRVYPRRAMRTIPS